MRGLMQHWPMTLDRILIHGATHHGDRCLVSQDLTGNLHVATYVDLLGRARAVSAALLRYGIKPGDRVGSLMWNEFDHVAVWFGAMGIGAVLHTLNPRLGAERIGWIADHGGDRIIVCGADLTSLLDDAAGSLATVERVLVSGTQDVPATIGGIPAQTLDAFVAEGGPVPRWGDFDEESAAGLCYTSGTTGAPKGVLYSHRSNMLHALTINQPGGLGIGPADVVLAIVPMFHANAWALPFITPMVGAELVLPGRHLHGASLARLIDLRGVTFAAGVPTIWQDLLRHLDESGATIPTLQRVMIGGSAPSRDLVERLTAIGVEIVQAWGMTEMSPVGTLSGTRPGGTGDAVGQILRQGSPPFSIQTEIFDASGIPRPHDDVSAGSLRVRGPNVAEAYFRAEALATDTAGWFDTGDIAAIDPAGSIRLVDRAKDVIKSGGEWISSIELENLAMTHPAVHRAAVIAIPDDRWGERPLLVIEAEAPPSLEEMVAHMRPSVPAWWLPARIVHRTIPLGATGKIDKLALRKGLLEEQDHSSRATSEREVR